MFLKGLKIPSQRNGKFIESELVNLEIVVLRAEISQVIFKAKYFESHQNP